MKQATYNWSSESEILEAGHAEPTRENYSLIIYMAGCKLRERVQRDGMQQTRSWMNSHHRIGTKAPGRNAKKLLETTFADFIPSQDSETISAENLCELYRDSLSKQMAA